MNAHRLLLAIVTLLIIAMFAGCDADLDFDGDDGGSILIYVEAQIAAVVGGLDITDTSFTEPPEKIITTEFIFRNAATNAFVANKVLDYGVTTGNKSFIQVLPAGTYNIEQTVTAVDRTFATRTWQRTVLGNN